MIVTTNHFKIQEILNLSYIALIFLGVVVCLYKGQQLFWCIFLD